MGLADAILSPERTAAFVARPRPGWSCHRRRPPALAWAGGATGVSQASPLRDLPATARPARSAFRVPAARDRSCSCDRLEGRVGSRWERSRTRGTVPGTAHGSPLRAGASAHLRTLSATPWSVRGPFRKPLPPPTAPPYRAEDCADECPRACPDRPRRARPRVPARAGRDRVPGGERPEHARPRHPVRPHPLRGRCASRVLRRARGCVGEREHVHVLSQGGPEVGSGAGCVRGVRGGGEAGTRDVQGVGAGGDAVVRDGGGVAELASL